MTITPEQCKAARILAKIDRDALAVAAGIDSAAIFEFEAGIAVKDSRLADVLRQALEGLGVDFLPETGGYGVGIRLKYDRAGTRQISRWESEGGTAADDEVQ